MQFWYLFTWFAFITQITQCPFRVGAFQHKQQGKTEVIPRLRSELKSEGDVLVDIQYKMFCCLMMFLVFRMCVKWARVTLLFKVTSLIRIPFLLLPALSCCGSSGPLPFQGCRLGLLGHSFLPSPWGLSLVDVCFSLYTAMLISQPRHLKSFVALHSTLQMHSYASRTPLSWLPDKCFQMQAT